MTASLDDLVSMAMFARVVEAKSFTAAAATLSVSIRPVSRQQRQAVRARSPPAFEASSK